MSQFMSRRFFDNYSLVHGVSLSLCQLKRILQKTNLCRHMQPTFHRIACSKLMCESTHTHIYITYCHKKLLITSRCRDMHMAINVSDPPASLLYLQAANTLMVTMIWRLQSQCKMQYASIQNLWHCLRLKYDTHNASIIILRNTNMTCICSELYMYIIMYMKVNVNGTTRECYCMLAIDH